MANGSAHRAFGRRVASPTPARPVAPPAAEAEPAPHARPFPQEPDAELETWKQTRRWHPPWRQIALMASLCFGIASLVLPDPVNDALHWLLYGLSAASFYAGWRKKRA